jgi:hypothetical protein
MAEGDITAARVRELLHYDPLTGVFTRKVQTSSRAKVGGRADKLNAPVGYYYVKTDCRRYLAHRLAWFYMTGGWPTHQIDHIDGDPGNNRFANLRDVSPSMNQHNRKKTWGRSGYMGVYRKQGRWMAALTIKGRQVFLGYHDTPEEAHAAYLNGKRQHHEGCTI